MSVNIGSDVVLANILYYQPCSKNGISFTDIEKYCFNVKKELIKNGMPKTEYILFNINREELNYDLELYSNIFRKFQNKYYLRKTTININQFNARLKPEISRVMQEVARLSCSCIMEDIK
jgi:hypothetical protein